MIDRELLEAAAKAAGFTGFHESLTGAIYVQQDGQDCWWNPLTDDGAALLLAVKLRINVNFEEWDGAEYICAVPQRSYQGQDEVLGNNEATATRRAIVRAAAAIGGKS